MKQKKYILLCLIMPTSIFGMEPQKASTATEHSYLWNIVFAFLDNGDRDKVRTICHTLQLLYSVNNPDLYILPPANFTQKQKNYAFMLMLYHNKPKVATLLNADGAQFDTTLPYIDPVMLTDYRTKLTQYSTQELLYQQEPSMLSVCVASYFGDNEHLQSLLQNISCLHTRISQNTNPLLFAVRNRHIETVRLFLKNTYIRERISNDVLKESFRYVSILSELLLHVNPNNFRISITEGYKLPLLHYAVRKNFHDTVSFLCNRSDIDINSVDDNYEPITPLCIAARDGHIKIVKLLLSYPQCRVDGVGKKTPLYFAIQNKHTAIVERLLDAGADCTRLVHGQSYAHIAASHKHSQALQPLLEKCPSLNNVCDKSNNSPLHLAVCYRAYKSITVLLHSDNINVDIVNNNNQTPLDIARENPYKNTQHLLEQHNAQTSMSVNPLSCLMYKITG